MTESLIKDWLEEYETLDSAQFESFATEQTYNEEVMTAIYNVLEERKKYSDLIDPVCHQLFEFYRTKNAILQLFTFQFIPVLIRIYLDSVSRGDKKSCRSIEALLISIYNLEVVDEKDQPKTISFRMPSIAQPSIYHEPGSLALSFITTNALRRLEECNTKLVNWGPLPQIEALNAQNRLKVMTALMFIYNQQLGRLPKLSIEHFCKIASKLVTQGFNKHGHYPRSSYGSDSSVGHTSFRPPPRVPLSSQFLLELLHVTYYAICNGHERTATRTLDHITKRSCYEAYADVQLLANAIQHSIHSEHGSLADRSMGSISATSPSATTVNITKSMITNASFRTKKLPDDIPIQMDKDEGVDNKNLVSISEEREDEVNAIEKVRPSRLSKEIGVPKSLTKLPNFSGLGKKLQKDVVRLRSNESAESKKCVAPKESKNRGSLLGSVFNGDANDVTDYSPHNKKKNGIEDMKNINSISIEMEKVSMVSDSLQSTVEETNSQLATSADSLDSLTTSSGIDNPNVEILPIKSDIKRMQVSTV